jgi:Zn-dependent membrane protease YugP
MFLWGLWVDSLYLVLFIVTLVISGASQLYIKSTFAKWNKVDDGVRLSGLEIGQRLLTRTSFGGATGISFKIVPGDLSDHFDPRTREVGLSQVVAGNPSVAAMAVTAHEVGHAQQHAEGTIAMKARTFLVPALTYAVTSIVMLLYYISIARR